MASVRDLPRQSLSNRLTLPQLAPASRTQFEFFTQIAKIEFNEAVVGSGNGISHTDLFNSGIVNLCQCAARENST